MIIDFLIIWQQNIHTVLGCVHRQALPLHEFLLLYFPPERTCPVGYCPQGEGIPSGYFTYMFNSEKLFWALGISWDRQGGALNRALCLKKRIGRLHYWPIGYKGEADKWYTWWVLPSQRSIAMSAAAWGKSLSPLAAIRSYRTVANNLNITIQRFPGLPKHKFKYVLPLS
jgi:hypothetical protein